jgi:hypothetical protein
LIHRVICLANYAEVHWFRSNYFLTWLLLAASTRVLIFRDLNFWHVTLV